MQNYCHHKNFRNCFAAHSYPIFLGAKDKSINDNPMFSFSYLKKTQAKALSKFVYLKETKGFCFPTSFSLTETFVSKLFKFVYFLAKDVDFKINEGLFFIQVRLLVCKARLFFRNVRFYSINERLFGIQICSNF